MFIITWAYRMGLLAFLLLGGIGAFDSGTNTTLADTPAIWSASNAIANAFQGALIGVIVGGIIGIVLHVRANKQRKAEQSA